MWSPIKAVAAALTVVVLCAACSDDGGDVRDGSGDSGSSLSESGSASASGSASGSGSASASACEPVGDPSVSSDDVSLVMTEWEITADPSSAAPGLITFLGENVGAEPHEFVIVRGDDPGALPTDDDGSVPEAEIADLLIGEVEPFGSATTCDGTFDLAAGSYVIFCNIVEVEDDGTVESHFAEGMVTTFEVA